MIFYHMSVFGKINLCPMPKDLIKLLNFRSCNSDGANLMGSLSLKTEVKSESGAEVVSTSTTTATSGGHSANQQHTVGYV